MNSLDKKYAIDFLYRSYGNLVGGLLAEDTIEVGSPEYKTYKQTCTHYETININNINQKYDECKDKILREIFLLTKNRIQL